MRDPFFVGFRNSGQYSYGGSILVGNGYKPGDAFGQLTDLTGHLTDLAAVRLNRLHQELESFIHRHLPPF
jgi:hypothetical protein